MSSASRQIRFRHALQREIGRVLGPLWTLPAVCWMRFGLGYRIEGVRELRSEYQRIRAESSAPLLICANHLTLIDSFLIAWALASPWRYSFDWSSMPWNTPERQNFAVNLPTRLLVYFAKCIPISRGGDREETAAVIARVSHLLSLGETALIFPEGGRSRSGRIDPDEGAWGVGRIVAAVTSCRVLCVYLRGRSQESYSDWPVRGERFVARMTCIEPKTDLRGARSWRDLVRQIVSQLARMEGEHFAEQDREAACECGSGHAGRQ